MERKITVAVAAISVLFPSMGAADNFRVENDLIEVMFQWGSEIRLDEDSGDLLDLSNMNSLEGIEDGLECVDDYTWMRSSDVAPEILDQLEITGEQNTGEDLYNLNNIYRLRFSGDVDVWNLSLELEALPGILLAKPVPLPQPLPIPPDYQPLQGYLYPASFTPTGIDALYAWTQTGGTGSGVTICDMEYSWNYNHNDITKAYNSQINTNVSDPFSDNNHGTAVLGEIVSDNNGWGTIGICYGISIKTCGTYYGLPGPSWNVPGAMAVAISNLSAGDIILLEQQWDYGSGAYIPIEWWLNYNPSSQTYNGVYAAIKTAVANGIHVVEAGGNGNVNTDNLTWYGDSGAMIIGAGGVYPGGTYPQGDLERLSFSSYGSRFNLQGWGENVFTTGYGNYYNLEGVNYYYTHDFAGTSSASPIVAGAAACCVGFWVANGNPVSTLTPVLLRTVLVNTGTPQVFPPSGNIGPRPDLLGAFGYLYSVGIHGDENPSDPYGAAMNAYPNPSGNTVTFTLVGMPGNKVDVHIYDLAGREIICLNEGSETLAGLTEFQWNCSDKSGNRIPSGAYIAVIETSSFPVTTRFVVIE